MWRLWFWLIKFQAGSASVPSQFLAPIDMQREATQAANCQLSTANWQLLTAIAIAIGHVQINQVNTQFK